MKEDQGVAAADPYADGAVRLRGGKPYGAPTSLEYFRERSEVDPATNCWLWTAATNPHGYGAMRTRGKTVRPHRFVYQMVHGVELPRHIDVCHKCDVRRCVNPEHLFAGTRADNMADCAKKGRTNPPNLKGEDCPASKLTAAQVLEIRASDAPSAELAARFGVTTSSIKGIRKGKVWRSVGGHVGARPLKNQAGLIRLWSAEEDAFVRDNAHMGTAFIAESLGRTVSAVGARSSIIGARVRRFMGWRKGRP